MCTLELSKAPMYEFHYDYIKNKYGSKSTLLFLDTDSVCMKLKLKMFMTILVRIKKCLILVITLLSQSIRIIQTQLLVKWKMKWTAIEDFVALKPKIYSILVSSSSEYKRGKGVNKNVAKIIHNEYKDFLLINFFL